MEVENLSEFLKNCCRVCLSVENEMVDSSNIVENFNKTIHQLLFECTNLKITSGNNEPNKLCEDCTTELVMVANFREKCCVSAVALEQLMQQINKNHKTEENERNYKETETVTEETCNSEPLYESIEYVDENVEYVLYDTGTDFANENDISEKSQEIDIDSVEVDIDYNCKTSNAAKKKGTSVKAKTSTKEKIKQARKAQSKSSSRSIIKHHCKQCGAGFAQLNNFTRHLQTHNEHEMESNLTDTSIDVSTEDKEEINITSLDQQARSKKNIVKMHTCQFCDRAFPSISLLATHTRIHTGERPFQCSICAKSFKTQGALDLHVRRHSGVKPYKCSVCNRGFVESSNLKVHMRTHTGEKPHRCVTCGRSFSRVFLLQIHQRTHTGEKPYGCSICDKSFAQQGDLAAHKRIHSGERPHRCQVCHKGFIKSSGLTQHLRRHFSNSGTNNVADLAPIKEDEQVELIQQNTEVNSKTENVMICYKEFNENSESFNEYLEDC